MKKKNDVMHARLVEDVLGCENGQKACETEGSWACTE